MADCSSFMLELHAGSARKKKPWRGARSIEDRRLKIED
jgi:hypothetical protein